MDQEQHEPERKEWRLPPKFEEYRERMYISITQLNHAVNHNSTSQRDQALDEYVECVDYIIGRILPKLQRQHTQDAETIQQYARTYLKVYRQHPTDGLEQLNLNHKALTMLLYAYEFDKVTPTILSL